MLLKYSDRNNEIFRTAVLPALQELKLQVYRIDEELISDEEACRACENIQESDYVVMNLDDWTSNAVLLTGIVYGIGRRLALLKNDSLQPVPLVDLMEHNVVRYVQVGELRDRLMDHFMPYVKPRLAGDDGGPQVSED